MMTRPAPIALQLRTSQNHREPRPPRSPSPHHRLLLHRTRSSASLLGTRSSSTSLNSISQNLKPGAAQQQHQLKPVAAAAGSFRVDKKPPIPTNKRTEALRNSNHRNKQSNGGGMKKKKILTPAASAQESAEIIELFRRPKSTNLKSLSRTRSIKVGSRPGTYLIRGRHGSVPNLPSETLAVSSHTSLKEYYHRVENTGTTRGRSKTPNFRNVNAAPVPRKLGSTISREEFHFPDVVITPLQLEVTKVAGTSKLEENAKITVEPTILRSIGTNTTSNSNAELSKVRQAIAIRKENNLMKIRSMTATASPNNNNIKQQYFPLPLDLSLYNHSGGSRSLKNRPSRYLKDLEWRIGFGLNIYVYQNGVPTMSALMIHIPPNRRKDMLAIFSVISERIKFPVGYINALYTMEGRSIYDPRELVMNGYYVVASNLDKQFKPLEYGKFRSPPLTYLSRCTKHVWGQYLNEDQNWCYRNDQQFDGNNNHEFYNDLDHCYYSTSPCDRPQAAFLGNSTNEDYWRKKHGELEFLYDLNNNSNIRNQFADLVQNKSKKTNKAEIGTFYKHYDQSIIPPPTAFAD